MSMDWNDIKGPSEVEDIKRREAKKAEEQKYIEVLINASKWNDTSKWNKERRRIYESFGFKKLKKITEFNKTGVKTYYEITSDTTFEKKQRAEYDMSESYLLGVLRENITDDNKLRALLKKIEDFLADAERKFGKNITPSIINPKTRLANDYTIRLAIGSLFVPFALPVVIIYLIVHHKKLNKIAKDYAQLLDAYYKKLAEFEDEFKNLSANA